MPKSFSARLSESRRSRTMIFFTSDTHYWHANIIKFAPRPFSSVEEMNEEMIKRHNNVVRPEDDIYNLGDIVWRTQPEAWTEIFDRLNGKFHLIRGNHDFALRPKGKRVPFTHPKIVSVKDYDHLHINGHKVVIAHYPFARWNWMHHGSIHLHGHEHGNLPPEGRRMDVGVDARVLPTQIAQEYRPIEWSEIEARMREIDFPRVRHAD